MADFDTYDQFIQAEDVQDEVHIISPVDNPVASMSRSIRATAKNHQWSEDELAPSQKNAVVEGADATFGARPAVVPLNNYTQIMTKTARVTGTLEDVDKYGRDSEMAYQLELKYGELANDEELAIVGAPDGEDAGGRQTAVAGTASVAREMAGLYEQIKDNGSIRYCTTDSPTAPGGATPITTIAQLEDLLLQAHGAAYQKGANPGYLFTPPSLARHIGDMAYSAGRARDIRNERRLVNVIDLYVSYYGELDVVLDRNILSTDDDVPANTVDDRIYYLIDFNYSATPILRATRDWPIAKLGDTDRRQVLRESTYAVLNRDAHTAVDEIPASLTLS